MLAWVAPLVVFGLVIFVHELGHFLAAKWAGVYAPRFSIGFGPALWRKRRGETEYIIAAIPLGGYVRMASKEDQATAFLEGGGETGAENPVAAGAVADTAQSLAAAAPRGNPRADGGADAGEATREAPSAAPAKRPKDWDPEAMIPHGPRPIPQDRWFESKPLWKRIIIMLAGVTMNVLLAWVVTVGGYAAYGRAHMAAVVDSVIAGRPAASAGFQRGDTLIAVDGDPVDSWPDAVRRISARPGEAITVEVARGVREQLTVTPTSDTVTNIITGRTEQVGRVGLVPRLVIESVPVTPVQAVTEGTLETFAMAGVILQVVRGLFTGHVGVENLGGPIRIAQTSVEAGRAGLEPLLRLIAFISVNLAVLNLLPIPILDGGQIVMQVAEKIRGRPFGLRTREWILRFGLALIALLIITVMYNDIRALVAPFLGRF
ncbi:MAG TPA: RIP metalloprotease RseP [Gemmatimonadaceae bacterium]|nr:RIP metalloprotease RseP [Gemmatimonadaceae bacterium]